MFLAENDIKIRFRYLVSTSESVGHVYAPTRHIGAFENLLPKMAIFPQMKKIEGCTCWVHIENLTKICHTESGESVPRLYTESGTEIALSLS